MVGQEHVLKALINALDHDRLHHAYLFTGTRGVGKTTIARILAKCLNCETGVSSEPCNQCSACNEINEGHFVDLIEVDAASRTKVEDTRELLENVQYSPTRGRYKVYLIDEVHMLSNSSFNALLKTLEEPPPHVKFLLATTDPQKLPVTVLSRCLQFSLKNMSAERIVRHLQQVLEKEMIPFEEAGLWQLGKAADGSMRDALSLTDQAIAFSNGKIVEADVRTMLGTIDQSLVYKVLEGLLAEDGEAILGAVAELSEHSPDYVDVLGELIAVIHRIAIAQVLPEAIDNSQGDRQQIYHFSQNMAAEDVQLYYQTALLGRRDLPLVPDPRGGFEMVLLRMLAFKPQGVADIPKKALSAAAATQANAPEKTMDTLAAEEGSDSLKKPESESKPVAGPTLAETVMQNATTAIPAAAQEALEPISVAEASVSADVGLEPDPAEAIKTEEVEQAHASPAHDMLEAAETNTKINTEESLATENHIQEKVQKLQASHDRESVADQPRKTAQKAIAFEQFTSANWLSVYQQINTGGLLQSTVVNCAYVKTVDNVLEFILDEQQSTLYDVAHQQRLADLLSEYFKRPLGVEIRTGVPPVETPSQIILREQQEKQRQAEQAIQSDPVVQQLQKNFDAVIVEDSIKPID
jgi:DNA polymerase-3 subunit gamma/tau